MGTLKQPSMEFTFTQKAKTFKQRSTGNIIMFVTESEIEKETILELEEKDDATKLNNIFKQSLQLVEDCFSFEISPNLVTVYVMKEEPKDMVTILNDVKATRERGILIYPQGSEPTQKALVDWTKLQAKTNKPFKCVVVGDGADIEEVIQLDKTQEIDFLDGTRTDKEFKNYIPSIASVIAGSGATRGMNYVALTNLKRVKEPVDVDESINTGHLVLINDEGTVRIALGINSKVTLKEGEGDDLKFLETTETIHLMKRDVSNVFKNDYIAKGKKNSPDMQQLFITDVNNYFRKLEEENILDGNYTNFADINVGRQREKLIAKGFEEAKKWDDAKVKNNVVDKDVYAKGTIKIAQSVINLEFNNTLV
ncbi:phage tail sheath C-terminal domain-containing protein [Clostridium frigidicarnis]|uniref:Phage tail sheath protein n=1 Tax=Clostridium frigidicarnis TaxID=84698 RepID=A0A1I0V242_9CLOT|nr:phage tail sheath C-terminal domain-containing protein [Clostridium frigidicarnis]SFA70150.1 Phage tail sheath protein [Clostridium frigidicarnis]